MIDMVIDRLILLAVSVIVSLTMFSSSEVLVGGLLVLTAHCVAEYIDKKNANLLIFYVMIILSCFYQPVFIFVPTMAYCLSRRDIYHAAALALPVFASGVEFDAFVLTSYIFIIILGFVLHLKTDRFVEMKRRYITTRDDLTEASLQLKNRLTSVTNEQDNEIKLAMLDERNRIAREIHDNVGHLLSSAILQLGAVMIMEKDENNKEMLTNLKMTLDESMNSIRSSVHNMRDESVDLYATLHKMTEDFSKSGDIRAVLQYEMETAPDIKVKYAIIAIVKEALTNVTKHSNATRVEVRLNEYPKLRQLIITDNGSVQNAGRLQQTTGMGLENIRQRTDALKGILNISTEKGFRIFISFPKD